LFFDRFPICIEILFFEVFPFSAEFPKHVFDLLVFDFSEISDV
jgi:hypothetical protein